MPELERQEGRILLAIKALEKGEISSISSAANLFNVPKTTLRRRLNGVTQRGSTRANCHKLTESEEEVLENWIFSMDSRGLYPEQNLVRDMANFLLAKRGRRASTATVGQKWVYNYMKRTPALMTRLSDQYEHKPAKCGEDLKAIQAWFDTVRRVIDNCHIREDHIYNFCETGFAMGSAVRSRVVTRAEYDENIRKVLRPDKLDDREWVTVIECINSSHAIGPTVIMRKEAFKSEWHTVPAPDKRHTNPLTIPPAGENWLFDKSSSGWSANENRIAWLEENFLPNIPNPSLGSRVMLVMDGSHVTAEFDDLCRRNNIILVCMPAHLSHLLQPAEVGCLSVLKRTYSDMIQEKIRHGTNNIDALEFVAFYSKEREQTYKSAAMIADSFLDVGLVPYNPEHILSRFTGNPPTTAPVRNRGSDPSRNSTSQTALRSVRSIDVRREAAYIKSVIRHKNGTVPDGLNNALKGLVKDFEIITRHVAALERENARLKRENGKISAERAAMSSDSEDSDVANGQQRVPDGTVAVHATTPRRTPRRRRTAQSGVKLPRRRCGYCRIEGHRQNRCPNKPVPSDT